MSINKQFSSDGLVHISSLLDGHHFYKIPIMQRNYVWGEENINDFITDIRDSMDEDPDQAYFIGSMVFSEDEPKLRMVIDGQQRITSITLLIAASIYHFKRTGFKELGEYYSRFLKTSFPGPNGKLIHKYRLTHHNMDNDFYKQILEYNQDIKYRTYTTSQANLLKAIEKFIELLNPDNGFPLSDFMVYLTSNVYIVSMVSGSINMAFRIFETLNDRGAKLQPEDLLKNMLLKNLTDEQYHTIGTRWDDFINKLTDEKGKPKVSTTTFLKHFLMSKGYLVQKKGLYDWFEDQLGETKNPKNPKIYDLDKYQGILEFVIEIQDAASTYIKAMEGNINNALTACLQLGVKQSFVIALAANKLDDTFEQEIYEKLETLIFSYVISASRFNEFEKKFPYIAKELRLSRGRDEHYKNAILEFQKLIEDKKEIALKSFEQYKLKGSDKKKIMYILSKLASSFDQADYSSLTIEHILPEEKSEPWAFIKEEGTEYKSLVSNIGNLTLLSKSDNSSLKNKSFEEKLLVYKNQSPFTRSISSKIETGTKNTKHDKAVKKYDYTPPNDKWDANEIKRRSKALTRLAEYVWFE
ncbi:DUF262 domain-containing protein [Neobacillus sp. D3-1R]|uniref:DUF262 domain-containing protein n=1 Tax=Neobacillus sp. D3-1R TaxID=3445778 RepID=UPI003F9FADA1